MIAKPLLKEIITSNEEFILRHVKKLISREGLHFPEVLKKTIIFYGVRRSGKTFILFDLFKRYSNRALYIDFEDERLIGFEIKDFEMVKETFFELKPDSIGREPVFLFDEVQNIKGWERFCRRVVERENIKVFVSGSSSRVMPSEIHTELRGRAWGVEILPFSFREYLHLKDIDTTDKGILYGERKFLIKKHFAEYMRWGGFAEVSFLDSEFERTKLLKEYLGAMFFRDIVERYEITNIPLLETLMDRIFSSFSVKFSLTSFYKQYRDKFPFSKDLLFRYYKNFLQSMLVFEVRKFAESTYKRMRNPAKVYLADTGLCRRITSADAGRLLENLVFLELKRKGFEVFYFQEKKECDFIAKKEGEKFLPIQVCLELNEMNREREIEGLAEACAWLNTKEGVILTHDEDREIDAAGIHIRLVPVWKWIIERSIVP